MPKQKICILCGKPFYAEKNAQRVCNDKHYRACVVCGEPIEISSPSDHKQCCSKQCTSALRAATMQKRFGVSHALQNKQLLDKAQATTEARFGTKHAAQNEEVKKRTQAQFQEKYGVDTPFQMKDFQQKSTATCMKKYGVAYTSQIPGRTEKMQQTNLERYGATSPMGSEKIQEKFRADMEEKYGVPYFVMTAECRKAQRQVISQPNRHLADLLQSSGLDVTFELHLGRFSYDLCLPAQKILLEIDPTYTHNAVGNHFTPQGMKPNYHKEKSDLAKAHGYRCIHIFDWDSPYKIVAMLQPRKRAYARQCAVVQLSTKDADQFCEMYHLQGKCRGQKVCYALMWKGEVVELMTFGQPRYNKHYQWELLRLCSKPGIQVIGGPTKLFTYFQRQYQPESIISYCDCAKFTGDVYERLGFKLLRVNTPKKIWSKGTEYFTDTFVNQRGVDQIFNREYGKGTSNEELMLEEGWLPVYDCGQAVYVI